MFNLDNHILIKDIVDRKGKHIIIPLYVNVNNNKYGLLEIDRIKSVTRSSFKVGFGALNCMFLKTPSFTNNEYMLYLTNTTLWNFFDESVNMNVQYFTFEADSEDSEMLKELYGDSEVLQEIILYDDMLFKYVSEKAAEYRAKSIENYYNEISE